MAPTLRIALIALALVSTLSVGCRKNQVEGFVDIDGSRMTVERCVEDRRDTAVEFFGKDGRHLRLVPTSESRAQVLVYAGEAEPNDLGDCSTLDFKEDVIDGELRLLGVVYFWCMGESGSVSGLLEYRDCDQVEPE